MKRETLLLLFLPILSFIGCNSSSQNQNSSTDFLAYVDPFIGTGFHGHTFPGPVLPHGRVQLSPDTHIMGWDASSGYHYDDTTLYGFSHTHLSGTGIGDMGDVLFLPFTGGFPEDKPVGKIDHSLESASPGFYEITVQPWNVKTELTTTLRTGYHRYTYPEGEEAWLMVDLGHVLQPNWGHKLIESEINLVDEYTIEGYRMTSGWAAKDPIWFRCTFNLPIQTIDLKKENGTEEKGISAFISFKNNGTPVEAKVSISSVDQEGARKILEVENSSFDEVVEKAQNTWRKELAVIEIDSKDESVLKNFYTALYHTKIAPMIFSDVDGRYRGIDQEIHTKSINEAYTVYSLWDVFRSWYPLMTVIEPDRARSWAYDLFQQSEEGGLLPKWALNGNYTGTMVGYPANAILADALTKGMIDSIPEQVLAAAVKASSWQPDFHQKHKGTRAERVMPKQIYFKETLGFVPSDSTNGSVSYGLEMAYYDWCVSKMAELLEKNEIASTYKDKGKAYKHYFDPEVKFMRGKNTDGSRRKDFNPKYSDHENSDYIEGNAWQWTPLVLHDLDGFAGLMGGEKELGIWLDSLFMTSSEIEGENASGDITGLIGQYAHGNEPSHHVPFMYEYSDRPWRTQEVINDIMYEFYSPDPEGIIGNEDCGQMSAWYVLNALGIYQPTPGNPKFVIGRPVVDGARIKVENGWFEIEVKNNSLKNKYVKYIKLNGKEVKQIEYKDIVSGGKLEVMMSAEFDK